MAGYKLAEKTIREVETLTSLKPYEGSITCSRAQQIHISELPKSNELDNKLSNVSIQDYFTISKVSTPLYEDLEALFQDENFLESIDSQFLGASYKC